ncbi:hypothetical protein EDB89DRAFT_1936450 [Lactarius sanguifluus]|nr:hypothetical protein EDB89DRAFT_1936450 [Lactarius sanguifluus]
MAAPLRNVSLNYHQTLRRIRFRVTIHDDYYLSFLSRHSYPPGLYTAIAHDGPLRTRIQCFWSELDEFWWHLRHARHLLFGWLATLSTDSVTSVVLLTRRMRAMSLRYVVMVWLLPVLDKIRNSNIGGLPVRSDSEGNGVAAGIPIPRVLPTSLDHPAPTTNYFRTRTRTYSPTDYHVPAASIAFLKARLGELDQTVNALEKSLSGRGL